MGQESSSHALIPLVLSILLPNYCGEIDELRGDDFHTAKKGQDFHLNLWIPSLLSYLKKMIVEIWTAEGNYLDFLLIRTKESDHMRKLGGAVCLGIGEQD